MASTGVDYGSGEKPVGKAHQFPRDEEKIDSPGEYNERRLSRGTVHLDHTHRKLKPRHIQLIGIGYDCALNVGG